MMGKYFYFSINLWSKRIFEPAKATGSMGSPLYGCMDVWMYVCMDDVCNELISETAPTIFLKLGMKLGDNKGKKIARPDFLKKFSFWPILAKRAKKWPKSQFLGLCKKTNPTNFLKLH